METLLDPAGQRRRVRQTKPPSQLLQGQTARQLNQRQRVTTRLGHDPIAHTHIHRPVHHRIKQRAGVTVRKAPHNQFREPRKPADITAFAHREHHRNALGQQPTRDEGQRQSRRLIKPLGIVDQTHLRHVLGRLRKQTEDCQPNHETVRGRARLQAKRNTQRLTLWCGQPLKPAQHRRAKLMQPGIRKLHLRLDARRPRHLTPRRRVSQVIQQHRLADPRLTANHQHPAAPLTHILDNPIQLGALARPPPQPNRAIPIFHASATIVAAVASRAPASGAQPPSRLLICRRCGHRSQTSASAVKRQLVRAPAVASEPEDRSQVARRYLCRWAIVLAAARAPDSATTRRWWRAKQLGLDADTINDYEWRLGYLDRFFGRYASARSPRASSTASATSFTSRPRRSAPRPRADES